MPAFVPQLLINNELVGNFGKKMWIECKERVRCRHRSCTLIGDCQNLALALIKLCGWETDYLDKIDAYKKENGLESFIWEDQYNFENIEANCLKFEETLKRDDVQDSSDEEPLRPLPNCFFSDDGSELETYGMSQEDLDSIAEYFVTQIREMSILNHIEESENRSEHIVLRWNNILVELNDVNSRCFREMIKWKKQKVNKDDMISFLCSTRFKEDRLELPAREMITTLDSPPQTNKNMRVGLRFDDIAHRCVLCIQHVVMLTSNHHRQKVRLSDESETKHLAYLEIIDGLDRVEQLKHHFRHEVTLAVMQVCVEAEGRIAWNHAERSVAYSIRRECGMFREFERESKSA